MPGEYTPSAPYGTGTDDYRCFLLDPELDKDAWLTGTQVLPGNPDVVHHVILFQVPPRQVAAAEAKDAAEDDEGWTCFGGTGLDRFQNVDDGPRGSARGRPAARSRSPSPATASACARAAGS